MGQREIDNMLLSMIQKHFPALPLSDEYTDWGKWLGFARAVYEAGRASPASVPGWKLVPDVPTSTMVLAGEKALSEHDFLRMDSAYCAMLATAPTPPVSEDKDKIIAAANALENIASTSSSTRIRRVANEALTAIRARRKACCEKS